MSELLKELELERVDGIYARNNFSKYDYWVNWDDIKEIIKKYEPPQLNENQQVVLEWLKEYSTIDELIIMTADTLDHPFGIPDRDRAFEKAFNNLNEHEKRQVFSAWVIEQEGEGCLNV